VESSTLKRTPLFQAHLDLGGRMVPFGGWEMPVQYTSILGEARAVRSKAGIFDVSHMGRLRFRGSGSAPFLHRLLSADVVNLKAGRARYTLICNQDGGIIDDALVYGQGEGRFLLVVNAANTPAVWDWFSRWLPGQQNVDMEDSTSESAMIAFQGPQAVSILEKLGCSPSSLPRPFTYVDAEIEGRRVMLARTGYTGEDGFELILDRREATWAWSRLLERGATPCGLGARDVLRLEAGLLLHGNDMDTSVNPFEAGLAKFVNLDKESYVAGDALRQVREGGVSKCLVGFWMVGQGIPRHGYNIMDGQRHIGVVTSGVPSPTLDMNIGMGYVPIEYSAPGTRFHIDIRGKAVEAEVAALPFYSRGRKT